MKKLTALISGRFDPINPGHIANFLHLGGNYHKVIIVILDYDTRAFPAFYAKQFLCERILTHAKGQFEVLVNEDHFGKIKEDRLSKLPAFDHYFAGNMEVLKNMSQLSKKMNFECRWLDRAGHWESTSERIAKSMREIMVNT